MSSLQSRLNQGLAVILCSIFTLEWLAADWVISSVAERQMLTRLEHDGDTLLEGVRQEADGALVVSDTHMASIYRLADSGHYFLLKMDGKVYLSGSLHQQTLDLPQVKKPVSAYHYLDGPQGQPLLVLTRQLQRFGYDLELSVAEDLSGVDNNIESVRVGFLIASLLALVAALMLQSGDVRRALRPLKSMCRELGEVGEGRQSQITVEVPTEINPLVDELNRLLLLVERRLQQSRTAIGNVAHALKTPLAVLYQISEDAHLSARPDLQDLMRSQAEAMRQRIERELKRARISGNARTGSAFKPQEEFHDMARLLNNIYSGKALDIRIRCSIKVLRFDRQDMLELAGNLLDNACKWANSKVLLTVSRDNGLILSVEDDGPGCAEEDMQRLSERGLRLDEQVQGHGLGLAIVRDITEFYHGALTISRSPALGGLRVEVRFGK